MANETFALQFTNTTAPQYVEDIHTSIAIPDCGVSIPFKNISSSDLGDIQISLGGHPTDADTSFTLSSLYEYSTSITVPNNAATYSSSFLATGFNTVKALITTTPKVINASNATQVATWGLTSEPMFFIPGYWTEYEIIWPTTLSPTIESTYNYTWYRKKTCFPYGFSWVIERRSYSGTPCVY